MMTTIYRWPTTIDLSRNICNCSLHIYLQSVEMNNPGADITFGGPQSERMMNNDPNQSFYQNQTDIQRQMRINPPSIQPYEVQQRRNQMNRVLAYELINKAYIPQQPSNPMIMPQQQVLFPDHTVQPNFGNQLPAMVVPAIINAALQTNDLCPKCQTNAPIIMRRQAVAITYRWCCILTFVCCCCVPFFVDKCLDLHFICSNCQFQKKVIPASYQCL